MLCAGYPGDAWDMFGSDYEMVDLSTGGLAERHGTLPFEIPGMSDVMPYPSAQG